MQRDHTLIRSLWILFLVISSDWWWSALLHRHRPLLLAAAINLVLLFTLPYLTPFLALSLVVVLVVGPLRSGY